MPRIYDNITLNLQDGLRDTLKSATHADFCVGYFNLRGWKTIAPLISELGGKSYTNEEGEIETRICRLLIGMQKLPIDFIRDEYKRAGHHSIDRAESQRLRKKMAEQFREQLTIGKQTNEIEAMLNDLLAQLKAGKLVIKLYLRELLHAKLYIAYREDKSAPIIGYVGSSNLTFAGMQNQCELNIDVVDEDAGLKLAAWFQERWSEKWCIDVTQDLINILEESWVSPHTPYEIYMKIVYHLSVEARGGLSEFSIPKSFEGRLLKFQEEAVLRAAKLLNQRNGVIIGDVVGLGKTITASAIAKIFEEMNYRILIICPANLIEMWETYSYDYYLSAKIVSVAMADRTLKDLKPYNLIVIDESHNLRNADSIRYKAIKDYISSVGNAKVILLSATPFNKSHLDLSAQLKLFVPDYLDLGIAPEKYINRLGGRPNFNAKHDVFINSVAAFEKSDEADDWREIMRLFLVRRTRSFVKKTYGQIDPANGRSYLEFPNGDKNYFPVRIARAVMYELDENDQYGKLYSDEVVSIISSLDLPRYGLGLDAYTTKNPDPLPTNPELVIQQNLGRAGNRLKGFQKTNLFKRLESSGHSFLLSLKRHILRNYLFLYAIENKLPLPIGEQDMEVLDSEYRDADYLSEADNELEALVGINKQFAKSYYEKLANNYATHYDWISSHLFNSTLAKSLKKDAENLLSVLEKVGTWKPDEDKQLVALHELITKKHKDEKVLIFTQFADTADYLFKQLHALGVTHLAVITGKNGNPTEAAHKFSPVSNGKSLDLDKQTRVLISTDVLSEGQNLQDAHIVLNYDLPWAIIRMIQRAGRVDRIGQKHHEILCYSFLPADGVNKIIKLRERIKSRLESNNEVIGAPDEVFFTDQQTRTTIENVYASDSTLLESDEGPVDISSEALAIWKKEVAKNPAIAHRIENMPDVVYSAKTHALGKLKDGIVMYAKMPNNMDSMVWMNSRAEVITTSQTEILTNIACDIDEPTLPRADNHHDLVDTGMIHLLQTMQSTSGQLGRVTSTRYKVYHMLMDFYKRDADTLFRDSLLEKVIQLVFDFQLQDGAKEILTRAIKVNCTPEDLRNTCVTLYEEGKLCIVSSDDESNKEPQIICSLGLVSPQ